MPDHFWTCDVCREKNPPYTEACRNCYTLAPRSDINIRKQLDIEKQTPEDEKSIQEETSLEAAAPSRRPDGSNIIPGDELMRAAMVSLFGPWLAWSFLKDERALFSLGKRSHTYIEVSGFFSSLLGALSMLAVASGAISIIADHFDRRPNEPTYQKINRYCWIAFLILVLLSIFIGWKLEHIQVIHK